MEVFSLEKVLSEWGFPQLLDKFKENDICDYETFISLNDSDLKELIPSLGIRKKFYKQLLQLTTLNETIDEVPILDFTLNSPSSSSLTSDVSLENNLSLDEFFAYPQRASVGTPYVLSTHTNSVRQLLESTEEGKLIIASYGENKLFLRSKLCDLIIKNELKLNNLDKKIKSSRFVQLSNEINEIFLHEQPELYFVPYTKNSDSKTSKSARGKLWYTYCYVRRTLRSYGLLDDKKDKSELEKKENAIPLEDVNDLVNWLKNNSSPFTDVIEKWKQTTEMRLKTFPSSIAEYFKIFPGLREPLGFLLIEEDFKNLFPEKHNLLFSSWPELSKKIVGIAETRKDTYLTNFLQQNKNVSTDILAITVLPLLLPSINIKSKGPGNHWKPSKIEQQQGFVLHIQDIKNLNIALEARKAKYEIYKFTNQPVPIIVGDIGELTAFYVSIEKTLYKVDTVLKAIDLCFKTFHSVNAEYPKESDSVWTFIQNYVYKITTKYDRKYISVGTLISDIDRLNSQ